jgi:nucleoside phosphorylase
MSFIGVVCGLKSEAAAVRDALRRESLDTDKFRIGVSGANAARAESIARAFAESGAKAIVSVGVSGGLDPALAPGVMIVTAEVVADPPLFPDPPRLADPPLAPPFQGGESSRHALDLIPPLEKGGLGGDQPPITTRAVYGSDVIIQSADEKAKLFARTGAVAVDMESHGAARAAQNAGLPFLALRAIADPAHRALPAAALDAVAPDGSTRALATLLKCAKAPGDFPALLQLGSDSEKALKALRDGLGPLLLRLLLRLDL